MEISQYKKLQIILSGIMKRELKVEYLHGFLTAVDCSPKLILPSVWMPLILSDIDGEPNFSSEKEMESVIGTIMRMYSEISSSLAKETFQPLYSIDIVEVSEETIMKWYKGFILGLNMWKDLLLADKYAISLIAPVIMAGNRDQTKNLLKTVTERDYSEKEIEDFKKFAISVLPDFIIEIWSYNHSAKKVKKQGLIRNAPCQCGSGKKYKHCCGK